MIRMSKLTDYAILILAHLARAPGTLTAQELAGRSRVPLPTVSKLAKELSKVGLVVSHRGRTAATGSPVRRTRSRSRRSSRRSRGPSP